jgi:hypothetical protein
MRRRRNCSIGLSPLSPGPIPEGQTRRDYRPSAHGRPDRCSGSVHEIGRCLVQEPRPIESRPRSSAPGERDFDADGTVDGQGLKKRPERQPAFSQGQSSVACLRDIVEVLRIVSGASQIWAKCISAGSSRTRSSGRDPERWRCSASTRMPAFAGAERPTNAIA